MKTFLSLITLLICSQSNFSPYQTEWLGEAENDIHTNFKSSCTQDVGPRPYAVIEASFLEYNLHDQYAHSLLAHTDIVFDGTLSEAPMFNRDSPLEFSWLMKHKGSDYSIHSSDRVFNSHPKQSGTYTIELSVKDNQDYCASKRVEVFISENAVYKTGEFQEIDLSSFEHLQNIKANEAWEKSQGEGIVVAIIDSGVHYNHPYIQGNIFTNAEEIPGNKIDDDQNGFVDDYTGWDFAYGDEFPFDDVGHGSHVAGLVASSFGVAPKAQIMPLKIAMGEKAPAQMAKAIRYAVDNGAHLINISAGSRALGLDNEQIQLESDAIEYAKEKGVAVFVSSGNGQYRRKEKKAIGYDIDDPNYIYYPASFTHENLFVVGASKIEDDELASYSNYGKTSVDIVTTGGEKGLKRINSLKQKNLKNDLLIDMSGTSMSTPIAVGMVALYLAQDESFKATQKIDFKNLREKLMNSGIQKEGYQDKVASGRFLRAIDLLEE